MFNKTKGPRTHMPGAIFGKPLEVITDNDDDMLVIVKCPNCGQPTEYGYTRMISGFIGCDNLLDDGRECYFGDLQPRVMDLKENQHARYVAGESVYLIDILEKGDDK